MSVLVILAVIFAALAGLLLVYAATRPDGFRIERSAHIQAPPEKVFAQIDDFRRWTAWSPWENIDPGLKRSYGGAAAGAGAAYAWEGNSKVGSGRMEITESRAPSKIVIKLDFIKPFEAHNTAEFTLVPGAQGGTALTWAMYGPSPYASKLMGIFMNMDRMVGAQFEQGLANLKSIAEK
jgi:uncharacterized protein YndB with AHSA1/START domain